MSDLAFAVCGFPVFHSALRTSNSAFLPKPASFLVSRFPSPGLGPRSSLHVPHSLRPSPFRSMPVGFQTTAKLFYQSHKKLLLRSLRPDGVVRFVRRLSVSGILISSSRDNAHLLLRCIKWRDWIQHRRNFLDPPNVLDSGPHSRSALRFTICHDSNDCWLNMAENRRPSFSFRELFFRD